MTEPRSGRLADGAGFITGAMLPVDGGQSVRVGQVEEARVRSGSPEQAYGAQRTGMHE